MTLTTQAILLLAIALLAWAPPASASPCHLLPLTLKQTISTTYDARDGRPARVQTVLEIDGPVPEHCVEPLIAIQTTDGTRPRLSRGGTELRASFVPGEGSMQVRNDGVVLTRPAVEELLDKRRLTLELVEIEPGQFVWPDTYSAAFTVSIDGVPGAPQQIGAQAVPVIVLVNGTSSTPTALEFGILSPGKTVSTSFFFRSNAAIRITALSENGGRLLHETDAKLTPIPYTARLNGRELRLGAEETIDFGGGPSVVQSGKLVFSVGQFSRAFAGIYRDVFELRLTAY